jgi:integrase
VEKLTVHDLRRTLASWQAMGGSSLPIIGRTLGHADPATTAIYARLDLDGVRKSVDAAALAMMAA